MVSVQTVCLAYHRFVTISSPFRDRCRPIPLECLASLHSASSIGECLHFKCQMLTMHHVPVIMIQDAWWQWWLSWTQVIGSRLILDSLHWDGATEKGFDRTVLLVCCSSSMNRRRISTSLPHSFWTVWQCGFSSAGLLPTFKVFFRHRQVTFYKSKCFIFWR